MNTVNGRNNINAGILGLFQQQKNLMVLLCP